MVRLVVGPTARGDRQDAVATPAVAAGAADPALLSHALMRLRDEDWGVRRVALGAVGQLGCRGDTAALAALTPHLGVRQAAVGAHARTAGTALARLQAEAPTASVAAAATSARDGC
mmetsp:Transcript_52497/g.122094  ORF Transcript_52497/g.122094 Transcript_52497/m.122094 type:complete len:116 (+) Transcript_52497:248-595(+)